MLSNKILNIKNVRRYVVGINKKVPLMTGKMTKYINFDNAASTPTLLPILKKVNNFLDYYSNIHRGTGFKSKVSTYLYDEAHKEVANFVSSDLSNNTIIFVKNTTEAINKLSYRLKLTKNDIVITSLMEHHSNDLPWRNKARVIYVNILDNGRLDLDDLESKLKLYKGKIKLVSVTGASNVTGYINDIHKIASLAHKYGSKILVDAAQLAPHRKINMKGYAADDYIDFLAFSAHKMYAPFGTGVLIGPKHIFLNGDPEYVGGGTIKSVTAYNSYWADLPDKEEAGTPNIIGAIALSESVKILGQIGMENIKNHEKELLKLLYSELSNLPGIKIYSVPLNNSLSDMVGVLTFTVKDIPHNLIASALAWEGGIGVRSGCFCAHPYIHRLLGLSAREISRLQRNLVLNENKNTPGMVRVSFGMYNNIDEIKSFINTLKKILDKKNKLLDEYKFNSKTGEYEPISSLQINWESLLA
jgi:selenocysteine lyase/cysteine desulfurase